MRHPIVTGLQLGDEGKGKITDVLAGKADWIIRFNGGNNAGHTLWLNGKKLVTHSVPSGVLSKTAKNFIGAGCVVDPDALAKEIAELNEAGAQLDSRRLRVDFRAHVTLPLHLALDSGRESTQHGIGTTKRGIGPTYMSKADRLGVRMIDLFSTGISERIGRLCETYNPLLRAQGLKESTVEENLRVAERARGYLEPFVSHEVAPFYELARSERCVLEGAQGVLLDPDHGFYPFVTSSNTVPAFAGVGTPFPMSRLGAVIGVAKAYLTRVGAGPFATELKDEVGERIRKNGHEFGATTGRPRKTGWLNVDELKWAIRVSDCTHVVITKGDILSNEPVVKAMMNGELKSFEPWSAVKEGSGLSVAYERYIKAIENFIGVPVIAVGTGPDREDICWRHEIPDFWKMV